MNLSYGMSIVGSSHVQKNAPCQDFHCFATLQNGWTVAAVADGVGSAKHSEVASQMACEQLVEACSEYLDTAESISAAKDALLSAYQRADQAIKAHVRQIGDSITDYDTTLSAVVFDGKKMVYGHSGDGGIVALTVNGDYLKVTAPQKAEDGICVVPLRAGQSHWEFGEVEDEVASILLATDGVYDNFTPYLLRGQPVEFYIPLIRWFMDNTGIGISPENRDQVEESRRKFLCGPGCSGITDDKTVVVVFNAEVMPALKEESYYAEPDWAKLQEIWNQKAYPHLYKDKPAEEPAPAANAAESASAFAAAEAETAPVPSAESDPTVESAPSAQPAPASAEESPLPDTSSAKAEDTAPTANEPAPAPSTDEKKSGFFDFFKKRKK